MRSAVVRGLLQHLLPLVVQVRAPRVAVLMVRLCWRLLEVVRRQAQQRAGRVLRLEGWCQAEQHIVGRLVHRHGPHTRFRCLFLHTHVLMKNSTKCTKGQSSITFSKLLVTKHLYQVFQHIWLSSRHAGPALTFLFTATACSHRAADCAASSAHG